MANQVAIIYAVTNGYINQSSGGYHCLQARFHEFMNKTKSALLEKQRRLGWNYWKWIKSYSWF